MANDANTVALWHLDGTAGSAGKKTDSSTLGTNTLTEQATVAAGTGLISPTTNGAYNLVTTGNVYTTSNLLGNGPLTFSIEILVKINTEITAGEWCFAHNQDGAASGSRSGINIGYQFNGGTKRTFFQFTYNAGNQFVFSNGSLNDGNWHYFAIDANAGSVTCYIDGVSVGTVTIAGNGSGGGGTGFCIGDDVIASIDEPPNALLDECRVRNATLSASAINAYWFPVVVTAKGNTLLLMGV